MEYETHFDIVVVNDQLNEALNAAENLVESFTSQTH